MPNNPLGEIASKYEEGFNFLEPRKVRQVSQLVLLNNLNRGDLNIASTLLLTLFNRTMSALYDDKMQVKFLPSQGINQDQINSYNTLAQSDYLEMKKAELDYDWMWDTLFFGRGYMETLRFSKKRKIMEPCVINPLMFGYDPYFENKNDWRYYWKWMTKNRWEIQRLIKKGVITGISSPDEIPSGIDPYIYSYKIKRDKAKKVVEPAADTISGDVYQILEYYGYDENGDKSVYWVDRSFSKILYQEKLDLPEDEHGNTAWPIVIKEAFREPHSTVNFSVADLLEDKHRAKSVLLNLAFIAAKDKANPLYWYDPEKVVDVAQFFSRQINQHIPVNGDGSLAMGPVNKDNPMDPGLINFISMLQQEATDPVGVGIQVAPETSAGEQTATEAAINQQLNDMAQSLMAKTLQFGEKDFWAAWFFLYRKNADALKSKMANIVGVKGVTTIEIDLQDFKTSIPPGVELYSVKEADYKNLVKRRDYMGMLPQLQASMDPNGFRNFYKHVFMPLMIEDSSLIDIMFPDTLDEMKAEGENELLKEDKMPNVEETDDHSTHIMIHHMVQPKTKATWMHIKWHEDLLAEQKKQEQVAASLQATEAPQETNSPLQAASPLKGAINKTNQQTVNK